MDGNRNNKRLTFQIRNAIGGMWEDSLTQACVIIANLQNILEIRSEDDQRVSCIHLRHQ